MVSEEIHFCLFWARGDNLCRSKLRTINQKYLFFVILGEGALQIYDLLLAKNPVFLVLSEGDHLGRSKLRTIDQKYLFFAILGYFGD